MISRYKIKIILWYTGLLTVILFAVFFSIYTVLGYLLRKEINNNIKLKREKITELLRETTHIPKPGRRFFEYIIARHYDFYDLREYTDVADDKYIVIVLCGDELMYISEKYEPHSRHGYRILKESIQKLDVDENTIKTCLLEDKPFNITAIQRKGYSVYLGYELSIVNKVQKKILQIFLIIFPIGILFSILCGYFVTQRSLNIIKRITQTANKISSKNLGERIKVPKGNDEIIDLINTLNSMINRLDKSFTVVKQFSHDAAHEIRTPLTIIQGGIEELMNNNHLKPGVSDKLENILEEMQYLSSIAEKLLLIHTLDTHEIEYHFTTIDLNRIIDDVFADAQILSATKIITIELEKVILPHFKGNEELLTRLFLNLIDNAVKYTMPGGKIKIILENKKSDIAITVKDTGIGIPPEDFDKIFDRFYRVDKSRSRKLGGSGLGLAICKWIVELHHGAIQVVSEVNKGSEFIVILPIL